MAAVVAEEGLWVFEKIGLPISDVFDFVLDIAANAQNVGDENEEVRFLGKLGFAALGISCALNGIMVFRHIRYHHELYDELRRKATGLGAAFYIWMILACTNVEIVLLYLVFVKYRSGHLNLSIGGYELMRETEAEEAFLNKELRNRYSIAEIEIRRKALISQLTENIPELLIQGYAVDIQIASGREPSAVSLFSLGTTFLMLFGKMLLNLFLNAIDMGVTEEFALLLFEGKVKLDYVGIIGQFVLSCVDN